MSEMPRPRYAVVDGFLVTVVLAAAGLGLWFDTSAGGVSAPRGSDAATPLPGRHTLFCPPAVSKASSTVSVAAPSGGATSVELDPGPRRPGTLRQGRMLVVKERGRSATDVSGLGAPVVAGTSSTGGVPAGGATATGCSGEAATSWYFPQGSTSLDATEHLILYNPHPDEAVARISLFTPAGEQLQANLEDVAIPSDETVSLRINDYLLVRRSLATHLQALRGRFVAWKTVAETGDDVGDSAMHSTLGATRTSTRWYVPEAGAGAGAGGRISVLNPSTKEAVIDISLYERRLRLQPPSLTGIEIPALSSTSVALDAGVSKPGSPNRFSALVQSVNGVGVVAEGTVAYDSRELEGVASELAADRTAKRLYLAAGPRGASDDTVVVMNAGSRTAHVGVSLLRPGARPATPKRLSGVAVRRGSRRAFSVVRWTRGAPSTVILDSDSPIVAARRSYGGVDVVLGMGQPLSRAP